MKKLLAVTILALSLLLMGTATALAGFTCYHCWSTNTEVYYVSQSGGSGVGNSPLYHLYYNDCNNCNRTFYVDELHNRNGTFPALAPTCVAWGWEEAVACSVCGRPEARVYIPPFGHTVVTDQGIAPTCTETGLTEGSHCSVCTQVLVNQKVVAATGHTTVIDAAVAPTCTETGLTEGSHCSVCSDVFLAQKDVPATGHTEVTDFAVVPTCTETGLTEGSHCSVCSEVFLAQNIVPANGHTKAIDAAIAPDCTQTGLTQGSHCSACKTVLSAQNIVPAMGHQYAVVERVSRTCEKGGYSLMRCARCGDEYKANITERRSHLYGPWSPAGEGTHTAECVRGCGHTAVAPCEPETVTMAVQTLSACPVCGAMSREESLPESGFMMAAVEGAGAETARGELPGELIARSADGPFGENSGMLRLYTLAYEFAGNSIETGPLSVSLPLNGELPAAFRLVCVSGPDAGKDIPFEVRDGALVFTASLPGAYMLVAE